MSNKMSNIKYDSNMYVDPNRRKIIKQTCFCDTTISKQYTYDSKCMYNFIIGVNQINADLAQKK